MNYILKIREIIKKKGLTQKALAEKIKVDNGTLTRYLQGKTKIDVETLLKIAEVLETDVCELLGKPLINEKLKEVVSGIINECYKTEIRPMIKRYYKTPLEIKNFFLALKKYKFNELPKKELEVFKSIIENVLCFDVFVNQKSEDLILLYENKLILPEFLLLINFIKNNIDEINKYCIFGQDIDPTDLLL